jgi:hypothetical protein
MQSLEDFYFELREIVARRAASSHLVDVLAFTEEIAERLEQDPVFGEYKEAEHQGKTGTSNFRIHGFTEFDGLDGSIGLVISKWSDADAIETLTNGDISQLTGWLETFARAALSNKLKDKIVEASPAYNLACTLLDSRKTINRIRLHIFSNCRLSNRYKEEICGQISEIPVERHIWDLLRIKSLYESSREREAVVIDMTDFNSEGIDCLKASTANGLLSYLCVIEGNLLANLYERYGSRLLEGNVRSFLGLKGGVNKGIRSTIQDSPGLFFAYNNGIAATASKVAIKKTNEGDKVVGFTDFQIVNGGQTTASILSARKKDGLVLDGVAVQMKLTEVDNAQGDQMIPLIAKYANTQNKVAIADFFANHPVHRKLEEISRKLRTPAKASTRLETKWFYERSRGQYQNERLYLNKVKRDLFDIEFPSTQLINKTDLAKFDSALNEKPWWISQGAQKNFTRFADRFSPPSDAVLESEFWETLSPKYGEFYYKDIISVAIIWKYVEKMVSEGRGDWYKGDYRAQIVAYTVAQLFVLFRDKGGEFDLSKVWQTQTVPTVLRELLKQLALQVQNVILRPPPGTTNVGEWAKKEMCWMKVKKISFDLTETMNIFLVDPSALRDRASENEQDYRSYDLITLKSKIHELILSKYWLNLQQWINSKNIFSASELILLSKATTDEGFKMIVLSRDFIRLLDMKFKAEEKGFTTTVA